MNTIGQEKLTEDECYARLRELIINGTYLPNQHLIENDLASAFHVNRVSIRTALARLEHEGLVERERYRGARVRLVTQEEAVEILETRVALEGMIARHAANRATDEDISELRQIVATMKKYYEGNDLLKYSETNSALHKKIVKIAKHPTASRLLEMLNSQNVRFQFRTILAPGRPERSFSEHSAIVEAIANKDGEAAETAMRLHLSHVTDTLRQIT
ncbi:GntR family transcriptional regulator [Alicyclobacillus sp. ALC3]|uniref:GntR family transcriptional regulator n=1 Tax=Alicyclobacillus sp. ALC3 TaxID=2796143 RepID=UPI0023780FED|nr:GntR family transcriptional regulator [Alicyclobacillus sp. ALC3]WDL97668.1 GntR family transcriptional regulator [Alicyclobacillus sp. ALC3]